MDSRRALGSLVLVATLGFAGSESAAIGVVGFLEPQVGAFVGVRGIVPKGTVVTGIRFFSNDATLFPQVILAEDAGEHILPQVGSPLRTTTLISSVPGYVTVEFIPYEVTEKRYFWAVIYLPDHEPLTAEGLGGGPGIGWRQVPGLESESSLYSVPGVTHEFRPALDISLVTTSSTDVPDDRRLDATIPSVLSVEAVLGALRTGTVFKFALPRPGPVKLDVYDVSGRYVTRAIDRVFSAGVHEIEWAHRSAHGRSVATGLYFYRLQAASEQREGKVLVIK